MQVFVFLVWDVDDAIEACLDLELQAQDNLAWTAVVVSGMQALDACLCQEAVPTGSNT